ncbi:hypothetical protein GCM10009544_62700 [Streptomyces stramineus]|uniref:Uncharacterized protein n=1 Tax=Streptomyces stramineus TaxID=173861 RepID=A0ABP3L9X8_9ACTN
MRAAPWATLRRPGRPHHDLTRTTPTQLMGKELHMRRITAVVLGVAAWFGIRAAPADTDR